MRELGGFGPRITQADHDSHAFDFQWPVFQVELTDDRVDFRMGLDVNDWHAGDPNSELIDKLVESMRMAGLPD